MIRNILNILNCQSIHYSTNDPSIEVNEWWKKQGKYEIVIDREVYRPWEENTSSTLMDKIEFL